MKRAHAVGAVLLAAAFLWLDPARTFAPDAARAALHGAFVAGISLLAALGAGAALLRWRAPDVLDGPGGWAWALGAGVALHGAAMLVLALLGRADSIGSAAAILALGCGWLGRPGVRLPSVGAGGVLIGALCLLPGLVEALAPPTDTDEIYQHLDLARRIAETGGMTGGFLHPDGSRPLGVHLVHASVFAVGGEAAPRLWHLGLVAALVLAVRDLADARFGPGRGAIPALALLGSWTFLREAGMAYNNHAVALWLLLAAEALLRRRFILMGWMCGIALAGKYTAAPAVLGMLLVAAWDTRMAWRTLAVTAVGVVVPSLPWWARNALDGLHPLFPYAGWPEGAGFVFVYPEKYGAGHAWADLAVLPWNLLMRAETDSFVFLGRLSLVWAALVLAAMARRDGDDRRLLFVLALAFTGWAAGAQILRYLLPVAGIAALMGGVLRPGWPPLLLWLVSLPANLGPAWERGAARVPVARGAETRDAFLERELGAWPALSFLRTQVPADASVGLLFAWHGYHVPQATVLGSVEDHVPTRWWLWRGGDASLAQLWAGGVTHLLVGDVHFIRKSYSFLDPDVFAAQFQEPTDRLRTLLLRDATRLFAANHWEVWRLDPALDVVEPTP